MNRRIHPTTYFLLKSQWFRARPLKLNFTESAKQKIIDSLYDLLMQKVFLLLERNRLVASNINSLL